MFGLFKSKKTPTVTNKVIDPAVEARAKAIERVEMLKARLSDMEHEAKLKTYRRKKEEGKTDKTTVKPTNDPCKFISRDCPFTR